VRFVRDIVSLRCRAGLRRSHAVDCRRRIKPRSHAGARESHPGFYHESYDRSGRQHRVTSYCARLSCAAWAATRWIAPQYAFFSAPVCTSRANFCATMCILSTSGPNQAALRPVQSQTTRWRRSVRCAGKCLPPARTSPRFSRPHPLDTPPSAPKHRDACDGIAYVCVRALFGLRVYLYTLLVLLVI